MKRFNEFVKRLSLTQQLFALIFFFVTFFAVFFFVYINGNVTTVIREQMYGTLDSTLQSWAMTCPGTVRTANLAPRRWKRSKRFRRMKVWKWTASMAKRATPR